MYTNTFFTLIEEILLILTNKVIDKIPSSLFMASICMLQQNIVRNIYSLKWTQFFSGFKVKQRDTKIPSIATVAMLLNVTGRKFSLQ